MTIYHLAWRSEWDQGASAGKYRASSLETEGFIHATKEPDKVVEVANLLFAGEGADDPAEDLLLVTLDESKVGSTVRYEDPAVGHRFPHIYGPIELTAVVKVEPMIREGGRWEFPGAE